MEQRESLVPNVLFPDLHNAGLLWMRVSPQKQPKQPEDFLMFEGQTRRSQSKKHGRTESTNDQASLNHRIWFVVHEYASGAPVKLKIRGI